MFKSKIILIILLCLAALYALYITIVLDKNQPPTALQNTRALIGGPFSLSDHHGQAVTEQDFRGKYMLIYFGYTYCPDICPTELQIMADALDRLPQETLAKITPLFITVDPARDNVEIMAEYVAAFHPALIGLTGTKEQINGVKKAYRVYGQAEKQLPGADPDAYLLSHTSYVYLMDPDGQYVSHFTSQTEPAEMALKLREVIE